MRAASLHLALAFALGAAIAAGAQDGSTDHPMQFNQADIETGTRIYNTQCAQCHGPNGDGVSGVDLRRRQFRRVATPDDLARVITEGVPAAGMPPFALSQPELNGIVAFIRSGFDNTPPVRVGTAARGRAVYERAGCASCHRIGGAGSRVAPDLSDIGLSRTAASLHQTLVDPSSTMLPINRPVRIVTGDGRTITGRRLNEDTYTVQLIDDGERLLSLEKRDIRSMTVGTASPMPSFAARLSDEERADLVAFLLTLTGR